MKSGQITYPTEQRGYGVQSQRPNPSLGYPIQPPTMTQSIFPGQTLRYYDFPDTTSGTGRTSQQCTFIGQGPTRYQTHEDQSLHGKPGSIQYGQTPPPSFQPAITYSEYGHRTKPKCIPQRSSVPLGKARSALIEDADRGYPIS